MRQPERTLQPEEVAVARDAESYTAPVPNQSQPVVVSPVLEIPILLFAVLKEAVSAERVLVRVPDVPASQKVTLDLLLACCARQYPVLEAWLPYVQVAVNCEYSHREQRVGASDEVALLPPVSGGAV
jgi:molybdopterin converting factor small subunit